MSDTELKNLPTDELIARLRQTEDLVSTKHLNVRLAVTVEPIPIKSIWPLHNVQWKQMRMSTYHNVCFAYCSISKSTDATAA